MTTFATDKQSTAAPMSVLELDMGAQKVSPDLSPSRIGARVLAEGYPAPPLSGACYLEISNQTALNLTAQAVACPQVSFTAASTTPDAAAAILGQKVGAQNLASGSIDLGSFESEKLGQYDFVVAADTFSTAGTAERMALLVLAKKHLSEKGVACIGLDVTPGWELMDELRARLCQDIDRSADLADQVKIVRSQITDFARTLSTEKPGKQSVIFAELVRLARASDAEVYRDLLDPAHHSMSIAAFLAMAEAAKLKPIGDLDPIKSNAARMPAADRPSDPSALNTAELFTLIDQHARTKRRHVLLVHAERKREEFNLASAFNSLCFTSELVRGDKSLSDKALLSSGPMTFVGPLRYRTENSIEIVALALMERHKYFPVSGARLVDHVTSALNSAGTEQVESADVSDVLLSIVQKLLPTGALVAHLAENRAISWVSDRPVVAPLALAQARQGDAHVTSLLPHSIAVDDTARFIISRLDGIQSIQQVSDELADAAAKGELSLSAREGTPEARAKATTMRVLGHAARSGLLVS